MSAARPLALDFPLYGSRLIEASAGTGKTYTISALYLRLVLGHGGAQAFARPLLPPEILVVTFTDAATRELRERIRNRLVEAAQAFRDEQAGDPLLRLLRADYPREAWADCAQRLDSAAQWMDEAAISTIHSWCQRMLREHAFDSGSLFTQQLQTDHSELLAEVVRDYWRLHCYPLHGQTLQWVMQAWGSPDGLRAALQALLDEAGAAPQQSLHSLLEATLSEQQQALAELKAPWPQWVDELQQLLDQAVADKQVDTRKLRAQYYQPWLDRLRDWAQGEARELRLDTGFKRLTPQGLAEVWKQGEPPAHPALDALSHLPARLQALAGPHRQALQHAAAWVCAGFAEAKRQRAEMGFDDMLSRLDQALHGDNGQRLAELIGRQFPVALIDEFQDTDPLQYRLFARVYPLHDTQAERGLLLIGDPKQAIYAFRGADIHTYLRARAATTGRHYHLDTNYRSSEAMVEAVNRLFLAAEQRPDSRGAFLFRNGADNPLPFQPVKAEGRREIWQVEGQTPAALQLRLWPSEQPLSAGKYRQALAESAASEITRLLNLARQGQAGFLRDGQLHALQPSDIAVLVRDLKEAQAIRRALAARQVRSVYLSDKDSVFASQEAGDLLLWLRACAEPDQERLLRAALASRTLGLSLSDLEQLNQDERQWEARVMQFRDYRQRWQRQGVLPMLRQLLHDFALPQQLMRRSDGERVLTNLLHLAELLQRAARELDGEQALLRHLQELLAGQAGNADEQVLRLESDEALVRVVTIHKSKGLEYPLVFLPFICSFRAVDARQPVYLHDGEQRRLQLDVDDEVLQEADQQRLAEDLRLLYVALTRARHSCWLGIADITQGNARGSRLERSALGYLLGGGARLDNSSQLLDWLQAQQALPYCDLQNAPPPNDHPLQQDGATLPDLHWRVPPRAAAEHWWIASYSALHYQEETPGSALAADSAREEKARDLHQPASPAQPGGRAGSLHAFPRGPNPGTFLHGLLEMAAEEGFAQLAGQPGQLRELIARRCQLRDLQAWIDPLSDWLLALLQRPQALPGGAQVALCQLQHYQAELEFWLAVQQVEVQQLDTLVRQYILPGEARPALSRERLNGLFKGFIDLVFEHQGRYYLADYKSNWLGEDDSAYSPQAMQACILEQRYDLQYALYLLALHRQLQLRLPDYQYAQHMGGALYLFLRGQAAPSQGLFLDRPPQALLDALDELFRGQHKERSR
ncbi:exodeoxyribonuclease V subunit beta [Pseudomonas fluvialis]|uniref:exodeoxyribonuclease V subunit beta n=1 Tax=Pseudomonas fluvialis TaxID=1793966 RepID=UPI0035B41470